MKVQIRLLIHGDKGVSYQNGFFIEPNDEMLRELVSATSIEFLALRLTNEDRKRG